MWTNTPASLDIRSRIIRARIGEEMIVSASDLILALDHAVDSQPGDTVEYVMSRKLLQCGSEFIASLITYGNIAPICVFIQDRDAPEWGETFGDVTLGNGHHRLAVLAHWGLSVKIMKTPGVHHSASIIPYEQATGVLCGSHG